MQCLHLCRTSCSYDSECHANISTVGTCNGKSAKGEASSLQRAWYIYLNNAIFLGIIVIEMYNVESFYSLVLF